MAQFNRKTEDWWKQSVFYQVYPKSFQDTTGDGIGDLPGVIEHIDYLADLGVDGIWLSPICKSPMRDNGYDISDYREIDPLFGTMEDFDELVRKADEHGMIIIMDLVVNHTSDEHPWFLDAKKSRDSRYHDYYIWRDGTPDTPPNDMIAEFGGPSWSYVPEIGQWYYQHFSPFQPDLNWDNPELRQAIYDMIRYWEQKGVGGFRLDAIEYISKDLDAGVRHMGTNLHTYIQEMRRDAFPEPELLSIGESTNATIKQARLFTDPSRHEFDMIFQFGTMMLSEAQKKSKWTVEPLFLDRFKDYYQTWEDGLYGHGWNSLFLSNHDLPRGVSRWGNDKEYRDKSAKMLAVMLHGMQGTPYVYQGEELGMTNIELPIDAYDDLEIHNYYNKGIADGRTVADIMNVIWQRGRDNARTPMQWTSGENAGFSTGKPWLPVNPNHKTVNAEDEAKDPDSVLNFYKKIIHLRKKHPVFRDGYFNLLEPDNKNTFCYTRDTDTEHMLVQCNFTPENQPEVRPEAYKSAEVILANYEDPTGELRPYEARMLYYSEEK